MPDKDLKDQLQEGGEGQGEGSGSGEGDKPEKRIKQLLKDGADKDVALKERDAKIATLTFENEFKELSSQSQFAKAADSKEEIQKKVAAGMSTKDAIVTTLHEKNLLGSPSGQQDNGSGSDETTQGTGGSADRPAGGSTDRKDLTKMTQAEKLEELKRLEAAGQITMD